MKKREIFFLLAAIALIIFQYFFYLCELYYDRDLASYAYHTLDILKGRGWYYTPGYNKPPGINLIILAGFSLFGKSFKSIYLAALFFNLLSVFFIYLLAKRVISKETKFYFLLPIFFALFFTSEALRTYSANTEVFSMPFEIGGILFLGLNQYLISGLLFGAGFLTRQTEVFTFFAGALFIIIAKALEKKPFKELIEDFSTFVAAFILPLILISVYFLYLGVFDKFLKYTFIFNLRHLNSYILDIRPKDSILTYLGLWKGLNFEIILFGLLSLCGLFYALSRRTKARIMISVWFVIICFWLLISAVYLHHFIQMIAPLSCIGLLGASDIFEGVKKLFRRRVYLRNIFTIILIVALFIPYIRLITPFVTKKRQPFFELGVKDRFSAAQYIKEHTNPQDKIFIWDIFDQGAIFLWSGRDNITRVSGKYAFLPAKLRAYWTACPDYRFNQRKVLLDLHHNQPKYIIVVSDYEQVIYLKYRERFAKGGIPSFLEQERAKKEAFESEKNAFPEFFRILDKEYQLEKTINVCMVYRLKYK